MGGGRQVGGVGRIGGRRREVVGVRRGRDEEAREKITEKKKREIQETFFHVISGPIIFLHMFPR